MTLSAADVEKVRQRASFACEYCGVTETDCGGQLTIDHHRPTSRGGSDDLDNLIYTCWRCNLHKADYGPTPGEPSLWNPRREPRESHLLLLADGQLHPHTPVGELTLRRLRLNRAALVAHRTRQQGFAAEVGLLGQYRAVLALLEETQRRQLELLEDHRALLADQRELLRLLLRERE